MILSLLMLIHLHAQCLSFLSRWVSWVSGLWVGGQDLPVTELPFTQLELIQHSCWIVFMSFFLILWALPNVLVACKFCVVSTISGTSFFPSFVNLPLSLRSLKHVEPGTLTRQFYWEFVFLTPGHHLELLRHSVSWIKLPFLLLRLEIYKDQTLENILRKFLHFPHIVTRRVSFLSFWEPGGAKRRCTDWFSLLLPLACWEKGVWQSAQRKQVVILGLLQWKLC